MKLLMKLTLVVASLALLTSCYERKVVKLDYSKRIKKGFYDPNGLPGQGHVGRTGTDDRYHGYQGQDGKDHPVKKPEPKAEEKKVEDKAPAKVEEKPEAKPDEKADEKTEEKATEGDDGKEKSLEDAFKG